MLSIKNLTVAFFDNYGQKKEVVKNFSMSLPANKITALVGQSGSGKSVIALSIVKLLKKAQLDGEIIFDNHQNILSLEENELQKIRGKEIGLIFQDPNTALNPLHKIGNQIKEAIKIHHPKISKKDLNKKIINLLKKVELDSLINRLDDYPHQLSGGQKQRVMIAIAIANNPKILIADEPTTSLDVVVQNEILNLLKKLCNQLEITILLISHNQQVVSKLADQIIKIGNEIKHINYRDNVLIDRNNNNKTVLSVKNLSVNFVKKNYINKNINFTLASNENIGIIGESGSGKSTMAMALSGLIKSHGEIIFFDNKNWQKNNFELRKKVQIIFQDPFSSLNPRMIIRDIVSEGLKIHNYNKNQIDEEIEKIFYQLHLSLDFLSRYPHQLSGGQRQRIAIARSIILQPEILILDEPTSALDFATQNEILKLLQDIQKQRKISYIIISHDLEVIAFIANKIAVLRAGEIIEFDAKEKIISSPAHEYTKKLISFYQ